MTASVLRPFEAKKSQKRLTIYSPVFFFLYNRLPCFVILAVIVHLIITDKHDLSFYGVYQDRC